MSAITLPRYFNKVSSERLLQLDGLTYVLYNQSIDQERVSVCVTMSMFAIIIKGRKIIHTEQGDLVLSCGDIFFAQRGSYLLSERMSVDSEYQSLIFFIDDSYLEGFVSRNSGLSVRFKDQKPDYTGIYTIAQYPLLSNWIQSILPVFLSKYSNRKEILKVKVEELLLLLINTDKSQQFVTFLHTFMNPRKRDLQLYMLENFTLPLSLDEFARQTGRSLSSFKGDFKTVFAESPGQWICTKRLERAYHLLVNTENTVSEICYEVGFESISHFIQFFKKRYGLTPKKLQQKSKYENSRLP